MRRINQKINIVLLFALIGVFFCSNPAYSVDSYNLRLPLDIKDNREIGLREKIEKSTSKGELPRTDPIASNELKIKVTLGMKRGYKEGLHTGPSGRFTTIIIECKKIIDEYFPNNNFKGIIKRISKNRKSEIGDLLSLMSLAIQWHDEIEVTLTRKVGVPEEILEYIMEEIKKVLENDHYLYRGAYPGEKPFNKLDSICSDSKTGIELDVNDSKSINHNL